MKLKNKNKLKKFISFMGCFALAFMLCAIPFLKPNTTYSSYAYEPTSPTYNKYEPTLSSNRPSYTFLPETKNFYSDFLKITDTAKDRTYYNTFLNSNNNISNSLYTGSSSFLISPDLNYNGIQNDLDSSVISPDLNFDYNSFLKSYLLDKASVIERDNSYSFYLDCSFYVKYNDLNTGAVIFSRYNLSSCAFLLYNKSNNALVKGFNFDDYYDTNIILSGNSNTSIFSVNISYLIDYTTSSSIIDFFDNYYFSFIYSIGTMPSSSYLISTGFSCALSLNRFNDYSYSPYWSSFAFPKTNFITSNDLSSYYYLNFTNSGIDYNTYWQDYYSNYYQELLVDNYNNGYDIGYSNGVLEGAESDEVVTKTIFAFASYPFTILSGFLNFNLFGFNIYNILLGLITTLLLIYVIKKLK